MTQLGDIPAKRQGHSLVFIPELSKGFLFGRYSLYECVDHPFFKKPQTLPCAQSYNNDIYSLDPNLSTMQMKWNLLEISETPPLLLLTLLLTLRIHSFLFFIVILFYYRLTAGDIPAPRVRALHGRYKRPKDFNIWRFC